jgi:hypothetical protein
MATCPNLLTITGPYFYIYILQENKENLLVNTLYKECSDRIFIAEINGTTIQSVNDLFDALKRSFHFPEYFGFNWNAVDECLNDLDWLKAKAYLLIVRAIDSFRMNEADFQIFIKVLNKTSREWRQGRNYNPEFSTQPTPFHVVMTIRKDNAQLFTALFEKSEVHRTDVIVSKEN